jgi:hypothetical protein
MHRKIASGLPALFLSSFDGLPSLKRHNRRFTAGKYTERSPRVPRKCVWITLLPCSCSQRTVMHSAAPVRPSIHLNVISIGCCKKQPVLIDCPVCLRLANINIEKKRYVSSSFILFGKCPRFRKIDQGGQNFCTSCIRVESLRNDGGSQIASVRIL